MFGLALGRVEKLATLPARIRRRNAEEHALRAEADAKTAEARAREAEALTRGQYGEMAARASEDKVKELTIAVTQLVDLVRGPIEIEALSEGHNETEGETPPDDAQQTASNHVRLMGGTARVPTASHR